MSEPASSAHSVSAAPGAGKKMRVDAVIIVRMEQKAAHVGDAAQRLTPRNPAPLGGDDHAHDGEARPAGRRSRPSNSPPSTGRRSKAMELTVCAPSQK